MYEQSFSFEREDLGRVEFYVAGGIWVGDTCIFEFGVRPQGWAGTILCDWREEGPKFVLHEGPEAGFAQLVETVKDLFRPFHTGGFRGLDRQALERFYAASYHEEHGLTADSELERERKAYFAEAVLALARPRKVLVGGCSAGLELAALRRRGVEAFGFDLCPDLEEITPPELRPFVRRGRMEAIPFGPEDGFDTLAAFDVFEHVHEDEIPRMVAEIDRLGVEHVVALIARREFEYRGHLTLRPLSWWDDRFAGRFARLAHDEGAAVRLVPWCRPAPDAFLTHYRRIHTKG